MSTDLVKTLVGVLGLSVVSGINLYAAVLTVGLGIRYGFLSGLPAELQILAHPVVIGLAAVLYAAEFVADKVPFFTPIWDGIHTFIRPFGAALLALQSAANLHPLAQIAAMLIGGSIALGTHSTKAGFRLLAHASPEPASHSAISLVEDVGVVALLALAYQYPHIALPVLLVLLVIVALLLPMLFRLLRFFLFALLGRARSWFHDAQPDSVPAWAQREMARLSPGAPRQCFRCFSRSGPVPRLRGGVVARDHSGNASFLFNRLFSTSAVDLPDFQGATLRPGLLLDVLTVPNKNKPFCFYVTKDWSASCQATLGLRSASSPHSSDALRARV